MGFFQQLKTMLFQPKDLVSAYGKVLEQHNLPLEDDALLPASKAELKLAILSAAMQPEIFRNEKMINFLHIGFISLANFQKDSEVARRTQIALSKTDPVKHELLVDSTKELNMDEYLRVLGVSAEEQKALAVEWASAFDLLAKNVSANANRIGAR